MPLTHPELVKHAAAWLQRKNPIVITEMVTYGEEADAIAFGTNGSFLIECKATRSDFLSDKNKEFRRSPAQGMGTYRYYMCSWSMIQTWELPENWGLLWVKGKRIYNPVKAQPQDKSYSSEQRLLVSAIRRIPFMVKEGSEQPEGCNIKFYPSTLGKTATMGIEEDGA